MSELCHLFLLAFIHTNTQTNSAIFTTASSFMRSIFAAILVFLTIVVGCFADWNGVYDDPIYGGSIYVCVTEVNGVYYGQGTFSRVGYMRGTIAVGNVFTGSFWLQGWEGTHGSFSLTLSGASYTGTFTQLPGITYTISGTQSSTTIPTDLECQKSDDYLLTTSEYYSSTGTYVQVGDGKRTGVISNSIQESEAGKGTTVGSYQYVYSSNNIRFHF
jgi:hypothetical protein